MLDYLSWQLAIQYVMSDHHKRSSYTRSYSCKSCVL